MRVLVGGRQSLLSETRHAQHRDAAQCPAVACMGAESEERLCAGMAEPLYCSPETDTAL